MKKEISFWKTQWFSMTVAFIAIATGFVYLIRAASLVDPEVELFFLSLFWFLISEVWVITALVDYNNLRIKNIQDRIERLENCAITDIVEESPNHYVVKRRLGPDMED
jgi:hypothetical protein